jgi:pectinesterase
VCEIVRREKVVIPITKPYITLQGEGRNRTVITWNDTAAAVGTLMSASVVVESDHFIARDISFQVSMKVDNDL